MLIALVSAGIVALASPTPCAGADISVTNMSVHVIKASKRNPGADRVLVTADLANIGVLPQKPKTRQHAELVRDGRISESQTFPALGAGVTYPLQFRIFRDPRERKEPLEVVVRYVLDDRAAATAQNCSAANDSLQKIF